MKEYNGFSPTQRMKALRWLNGEYAAGRRTRPTACDACGETEGVVEAHSENYSAPFGDHIGRYGLCYRCHMMLHVRVHVPEHWHLYRAALVAGVRFEPYQKRNWWAFRAQHVLRWRPVLLAAGPARPDVLGEMTGTRQRSEAVDREPTLPLFC